MRQTQHPSNNSVLGAPPGVGIEACTALAITRVQFPDGTPAVRSYWRPTDAERAAIASGALVELTVWGTTHAPLYVGVDGVDAP